MVKGDPKVMAGAFCSQESCSYSISKVSVSPLPTQTFTSVAHSALLEMLESTEDCSVFSACVCFSGRTMDKHTQQSLSDSHGQGSSKLKRHSSD